MNFEKSSASRIGDRDHDLPGRHRIVTRRSGASRGVRSRRCPWYQLPTCEQKRHRDERGQREPRDARLAARQHDERRQQRAERRSEVAADLEERLREPMPPA